MSEYSGKTDNEALLGIPTGIHIIFSYVQSRTVQGRTSLIKKFS
jgi:hypothetical protein